MPSVEIEDLAVERGFTLSGDYGEPGEAGQVSGYIDYGDGEEDYL